MLTKNYYAALFAHTGCTTYGKNTAGDSKACTRTTANYGSDNYIRLLNFLGFIGMDSALATSYTYDRVVIGTGITPPSETDYVLSGALITTIDSTVSHEKKTLEDGSIELTSLYTITNTGSEAITIGEIAYCGGLGHAGSLSSAIFDRQILEAPITIEAGGVGQVTYTIHIDTDVGIAW